MLDHKVADALAVECAIKGLTLRRVNAPVAGDVIVAAADDLVVLPDDCSFTSTVRADGTREYRIGEAAAGEYAELRAYAETVEPPSEPVVDDAGPVASASQLERLINAMNIDQKLEAGKIIFARAAKRITNTSPLYEWSLDWESEKWNLDELERLAESDAEFDLVWAHDLYHKLLFENVFLWLCERLIKIAAAYGDTCEEEHQIADIVFVMEPEK